LKDYNLNIEAPAFGTLTTTELTTGVGVIGESWKKFKQRCGFEITGERVDNNAKRLHATIKANHLNKDLVAPNQQFGKSWAQFLGEAKIEEVTDVMIDGGDLTAPINLPVAVPA
jgi:hypothetical protein